MRPLEQGVSLVLVAAQLLIAGCVDEPQGEAVVCVESSPLRPKNEQHPRASEFQAGLQKAVDSGLPGAVMAIRDADGVWEGASGFADLDRGTEMETCHATRIASVTKPFVSVATMRLVEDGVLDLDETVANYLPDEAEQLPHAEEMTLRELLNHTSGVHNFLDLPFVLKLMNRPSRTWTMREAYEHALSSKADFAPGEDWSYSNTNYLLVAWIIEAVTGQRHEEFLQESIFEPLRLRGTSYRPDVFDFSGVTHGYLDIFGNGALVNASSNYANSCVGPDGGMVSTAHDLLVFMDTVWAQGDFLERRSLEEMEPVVPTGEDLFPLYGLGLELWEEEGTFAVGHGGHEFGYRTFAYYFPEEDVTFVLWFNASSLNPTDKNIAAVINAQRLALRNLVLRHE